jgi:hypothetical protein
MALLKGRRTTTISLPIELVNFIEMQEGRFFSQRLENIVLTYAKAQLALVRYDNQKQIDQGEPTLLNSNAVRVWAWSAHLKGYDYTNRFEKMLREISKNLKDKSCSVSKVGDETLHLLQKDKDLLVQEIKEEDFREIWIAEKSSVPDCSKCSRMERIKKICDNL